MPLPNSDFFLRFLTLAVICLFICPGRLPVFAGTSDQVVISPPAARNSIESYLEAIAVNEQPISPTSSPQAEAGDVITFRVLVENTYPGALRNLLCGVEWGHGLIYQGGLRGNNVKVRHDSRARKIVVDIDEIQSRPVTVGDAEYRPGETDHFYLFDLMVAGCEDLSVDVYTDELYSRRFLKKYHVAVRILTPNIQYSVNINHRELISGQTQTVSIPVENTGDGTATGIVIDTNLDKFPVIVSRVSPGFRYITKTGIFVADSALAAGRSVDLEFDVAMAADEGSAVTEDAILFGARYKDDCGLGFRGRETLVVLRPVEQRPEGIIHGADLGVDISLRLPDMVDENEVVEATIEIIKTGQPAFYDLEVVMDTGSYAYLDNLTTSGFDGRKPEVVTSRPDTVVFSFDTDPERPEPLHQGGSIRFLVRKKDRTPADLVVSARFLNWLDADRSIRAIAAGRALDIKKRVVSAYAKPISHKKFDLNLRVFPEYCRVEPGEPLSWTVYVTNRGNATAFNVKLQNILGRNLEIHEAGNENAILTKLEESVPPSGETSLTWNLGDIEPSQTREVSVTALPRDLPDDSWRMMNDNTIRVISAGGMDDNLHVEKAAPRFIFPGEPINTGDVFGEVPRVHGFFSLTQIYKSNLYRTAEHQKHSWVTCLTPGIWAALPASRDRLVEINTTTAAPGGYAVKPFYPGSDRRYQTYLLYSPQFEFYHDQSDNDFVSHRLDGFFRYNSRNRFSFQVTDQYKRSHDSLSWRYTLDDKYQSNLFSSIATFDPTRKLRLRLDYSNFYLDYDDHENDPADRMDNSWSLYGFFNLTSKTALFAEYEYAHIHYSSNALDSNEHRYFGGIRWEITRKTKGRIKGGYGKKIYDASVLTDIDTWMAEIMVDHDLTPRTNAVVNAVRRYDEALGTRVDVNNLPRNLPTHILTNLFGLSVTHNITGKTRFNLNSTYTYDEYGYEEPLLTIEKRKDKEFVISPAVKFDFQKWLTFDLSYVYTRRDSNHSHFDYTDHTVFLRAGIYR